MTRTIDRLQWGHQSGILCSVSSHLLSRYENEASPVCSISLIAEVVSTQHAGAQQLITTAFRVVSPTSADARYRLPAYALNERVRAVASTAA